MCRWLLSLHYNGPGESTLQREVKARLFHLNAKSSAHTQFQNKTSSMCLQECVLLIRGSTHFRVMAPCKQRDALLTPTAILGLCIGSNLSRLAS